MTKPNTRTTNLYEESLLEVDKYKELAMEQAKKAVLESITPMIKKQLDINLNSLTEQQVKLFVEEAEDPFTPETTDPTQGQPPVPTDPPVVDPQQSATPPVDPTTPVAPPSVVGTEPTDLSPPVVQDQTTTTSLPITPPTATGLNVPMPGPDGKVVVDLEMILSGSGDLLEPTPLTPDQPDLTGGAIDPTNPQPTELGGFPETAPPTDMGTNPLKEWKSELNRLFSLTETVKTELGKLTLVERLAEQQEKLIELKESKVINDSKFDFYNGFVERFYNVLKGNINESNIYSKNTEEVMLNKKKSSVAEFAQSLFLSESTHTGFGDGEKTPKGKPELGGDESAKHAMKISGKQPADPGKSKALVVEEETEVEPEVTTEVAKPDGPKDKSEGWTKAKLAKKKAALKEQAATIAKQLQECESMEMSSGGGESHVGNVTLHADNVTIVSSGAGDETDLGAMSDDDEIDVVPDTEGGEEQPEFLGGDDDVVSGDETEEDEEEPGFKKESASYKQLQKEHVELQLVTAQSLYLNKLFAKEGVTLGMKKKITEHMDKAKSLTEAKEVYFKLKTALDENLSKHSSGTRKLTENKGASASSGTTPAKKVVAENTTTNQSGPFSRERFMHLAGIVKK
jgi:hypothetical protein